MTSYKKQTLVILNGWGDFQNIWQPLLEKLSTQYKVKFINTCANVVSADFDMLVKNIEAHIPDNAYLMGWSLGAQVACYIASKNTCNIKKLITFAFNPKFIETDTWPGINLATFTAFYNRFTRDPHAACQYFFKLQLMGEKNMLKLIKQVQVPDFDDIKLRYGLDFLQKNDLRNLLPELKIPNLHIYGKNDYLVPFEVTEKISQMKHIIDDAGHTPFYTYPDVCLKKITEFLNG